MDEPEPLAAALPDYRPSCDLRVLEIRSRLLAEVRKFFADGGYWEVETPILAREAVIDAHLDPFVVTADPGDAQATPLFLQTSPELAMKRLLAAGAQAIYQVGKVARQGEWGPLHNPEFTMLEWYRVGDTHHDQMRFTQRLIQRIASAAGEQASPQARSSYNWQADYPCLTYDAAFARAVGRPVLQLTPGELERLAADQGVQPPDSLDRSDRDAWLNLLLAECVEPTLGREVPEFVTDYPDTQSALARVRPDNPPVAERFELYAEGVELLNGYHELTDPRELECRQRDQNRQRLRNGLTRLPEDNRLLAAMQAGLPPCAGVALGWDRLLMKLLGCPRVSDVMSFAFDRV